MAITETGPSTSAARTYICYPLLPPTEGTSSPLRGKKKTTDKFPRLILVDSTRAGKRLPDALSKTVSIWCAVVNRAARLRGLAEAPSPSSSSPSSSSTLDIAAVAAAEDLDLDFDLRTPPGAVSPHEHAQIAARLDGWATALAVSCVPAVLTLLHPCSPAAGARAHTHIQDSSYALPELARPLRPLWITPASARFPYVAPDASSFLPVICVSASRAVDAGTERRMGGFSYVQGSGDDHELWGKVRYYTFTRRFTL